MNVPRLNLLVAEDEAPARERLVAQLRAAGCRVDHALAEGRGVMELLATQPGLDGLFLDIHMPNVDGLAILEAHGRRLPTVLVTTFPEHAVEAYTLDAVDYILKPVTAARLERALRRIELRRGRQTSPEPAAVEASESRYPVQLGGGILLVSLQRTTHFELDQEGVWAHAERRLRTRWKTLGEVEEAFPGGRFLRIHRHLLVRPEAVVGLNRTGGGRVLVRLMGGTVLEASRGGAVLLRAHLRLG